MRVFGRDILQGDLVLGLYYGYAPDQPLCPFGQDQNEFRFVVEMIPAKRKCDVFDVSYLSSTGFGCVANESGVWKPGTWSIIGDVHYEVIRNGEE